MPTCQAACSAAITIAKHMRAIVKSMRAAASYSGTWRVSQSAATSASFVDRRKGAVVWCVD
eukprot:582124-Amphidinium_carterae.1